MIETYLVPHDARAVRSRDQYQDRNLKP